MSDEVAARTRKKPLTLRQMEIVTDVDKLKVDLQATFMKYETIKQWAYIIHDKDDTRPHYHIYLNFDYPVSVELVAKWFQVPDNFINRVKGRKADILKYLTHSNDSQKFKYQYDPSDVIANFDIKKDIEESEIVGNFDKYSYAEQLAFIQTVESIPEKTRLFGVLQKTWQIKCQSDCLKADRDMQVIFITGKSGSGKTYYAKKILDKMKLDYCVSSSSNDPFQDYLGQRAIILDDLRDSAFDLEDLLKILDNNTKSSVKSRFTNKVFNGKVLVVTSSVPINYWYSCYRSSKHDDLIQLYRRIGTYIRVTNEYVEIYDDGLDGDGYPKGHPKKILNEIAYKEFEEKPKRKISELFVAEDLPF